MVKLYALYALDLLNLLDFIMLMIHNLQSIMSSVYTSLISRYKKQSGFTIVEVLIVIVIIAILAAIGTTVFAQMNTRAYDASVQSDLSNIAKKIKLYHAEYGVYPAGASQLATLNLRINKAAYGSHYNNGSGNYNLLYCRMPSSGPTEFALVAFSRTGKGFQYANGAGLSSYTGTKNGSIGMCTSAGLVTGGADRDWFYETNNWQSYIGG